MTGKVNCPACGQSDQVEKVSNIYVLGIEQRRRLSKSQTQPEIGETSQNPPALSRNKSFPWRELSRRLAPPASGKQVTRPIHPDLVVLTFSLTVPIFIYGIISSQPVMLLPMLLLLVLSYGLYFWKRAATVAKFERQRLAQQASADRIKRGIEIWMKLYYCAREDIVFELGKDRYAPADQMNGYLFDTGNQKAR